MSVSAVFDANNMARLAYAAAVEADGYWAYGFQQTRADVVPAMDAAFRTANAKLDHTLPTGKPVRIEFDGRGAQANVTILGVVVQSATSAKQ